MGSTEWDRRGSLHECLDSSKEPRRRKDKLRRKWRPWIMMLIMTSAIYYIYTHRADLFPDLFEPQLPVNVKIVANTEAYTKPRKEKVLTKKGKGLFNKGRLYNAGFQEMMKFNTFHCVVFHDLDLLPMNSSILYTCPLLPRHLCAKVDDTDLKRENNQTLKFKSIFGGVVSMSVEQFQRANGFSNLYFGWGGEDNDIFWRLHAAGYPVVRYSKSVGVYDVLPHKRDYENPFR
ncbi:unnamed protein product [Chrysodeixis includens]|uniref:Uncharacterized protein n=1 Tax=Chrysodeixis includens TaxID=689277 RepID=A0A9N8KWJ7_CHRIL|nr:unnamed protein product [Chrysodeixis includens]